MSRKARALVAFLVLSDHNAESRERLVGLLWSETSEDKARASLRQVIHELREAFAEAEFGHFTAGRTTIALDRARCAVDIHAVVAAAESGQIDRRLLDVERITDTLLESFEDVDPAFRIWLLAKRQTLVERLTRLLEARLRAAPSPGCEHAALALMQLDPTHEEACRCLIRARADRGDVPGALRVYKRLWDLLAEDYDLEPSQQTQDAIVAIKQGGGATMLALPAQPDAPALTEAERIAEFDAAAPPRVVIGVEPFDMTAIAADKTYLVQGFRHEFIACLVRFREWLVKDRAVRALDLAAASGGGPEYVVGASAFQADGAIRLIITLREIDSEHYVWGDRFQMSLDRWFETQQSIVRRIAIALNVHVSSDRIAKLAAQPDSKLQAYDRWLRGQALIYRYTPQAWQRASDTFREIIAATPDFAPAYSSLVQLNNSVHLVHPGVFRDRARQHQTLTLARKAAALDPVDSRAQLALGWAQAMAGQFSQGELNLGLAVDLNDNDPWTLISSAHGFAFCGDMVRADGLARQALALSVAPSQAHWGYQVGIRFLCGDYEGSVEAANRANDIIPNLPAWKASALHHLGRVDEARAEAARFVEMSRAKWFGSEPPTDDAIGRWFLHLFPISRRADWERLRRGLAGAGLAPAGAAHGAW
ncbi:MAG: trifolitoxin synthesis, TfuA [Alphaproteobacteria bacterium]|nr:trifolitoxin synthesis, TfuA [Alphaproteobacteria bacterium]